MKVHSGKLQYKIREQSKEIRKLKSDLKKLASSDLKQLAIAIETLELANEKLQESINGQFRKFYDEADKDMRLAKSFIESGLRRIKG